MLVIKKSKQWGRFISVLRWLLHCYIWFYGCFDSLENRGQLPALQSLLQDCTERSPKGYGWQRHSGGSISQLKRAVSSASLERFSSSDPPKSVKNVIELNQLRLLNSNGTLFIWYNKCLCLQCHKNTVQFTGALKTNNSTPGPATDPLVVAGKPWALGTDAALGIKASNWRWRGTGYRD